jgi:hypothetical protein
MLILTDYSLKQKWKMVKEAITKEMSLTNETAEIKRNFGVSNN